MIKEWLRADEIKVALVAALCILGSAIIFKRVLHTEAEGLLSRAPTYLIILYLFTRGAVKKDKNKKSNWYNPLYWSLAVIFFTVLPIVLHVV